MKEYTVTVRTLDGSSRKTTEVPFDMNLGDFREAASEVLGLSGSPSCLIYEETHQVVKENTNFEELNIKNGTVFIVAPIVDGGGDQNLPQKTNDLFLRVTYQDKTSEVSVPEDTTVYLLLASSLDSFIRQNDLDVKENHNYKALLRRTNQFLKKTNTLFQESITNNDELIIVRDLEDPIDKLKLGYQVPPSFSDKLDISAPVSIPKREDMAVSLVPVDIVYRLEEYRSDQQYWESTMWALVGAILGVVVNWSTSEPLVISKMSVIILIMLLVFSFITLSSALKYRKRADRIKERMLASVKPTNPD